MVYNARKAEFKQTLCGRLVAKGGLAGDAAQVVDAEVVADVLAAGVEPVPFLILMQASPQKVSA